MRKSLRGSSVCVAIFFVLIVLRSESDHRRSRLVVPVKVRPSDPSLVFVIGSIEDLQHIFPDELIVSIQVDPDGIWTAVVVNRPIVVLQSCQSIRVFDVRVH